MPETGSRNDPFNAFNFLVEIEGVTVAGFSEASGLNTETDAIEYRTGAEDITVRKLPGLKKFANIVLKRGYTNSKELWDWRKRVMDGKTQRQSGSVVLLNETRQEALRWNFREGWPRKLDAPTFNAKTNDVAVETLEIAHEGIDLG
jgi:phage tail-like protein